MQPKQLSEHIYAFHADILHDPLFEGMWPIPNGVTLNSYLVKSNKTALIDFVRDWDNAPAQLADQCEAAGVPLTGIDYLVLNHLEPDHAGHIRYLRTINPGVEIIATARGVKLIREFVGITENLRAVRSGDVLDLGGVKLSFIETPNVHWPETMMTYEGESKTLFSCDAFGSYGKTGERLFDDEFSEEEHRFYQGESLRYYANIVAAFSPAVNAAIKQLADLPVKVVAPSHGLVWRKAPQTIINRYARYAGYNTGGPQEREICVVCGSMYGNTRLGADLVVETLKETGIPVTVLNIPDAGFSEALAAALRCKGLVIAMPTYEYHMFPPMAQLLTLMGEKRLSGKIVLRIGSWGWVGGAQKHYEQVVSSFKWEHVPAYEWQGVLKDSEREELQKRARELAERVTTSSC